MVPFFWLPTKVRLVGESGVVLVLGHRVTLWRGTGVFEATVAEFGGDVRLLACQTASKTEILWVSTDGFCRDFGIKVGSC